MNYDFLVTREVICQWFSLVTSSLVKIIGKSPHSWPKKSLFTVTHALFFISWCPIFKSGLQRICPISSMDTPLQWRHNECNDISNHQPHDCLLNCLFRCKSKKTSKLRVTGLWEGNSLVTGEFPTQRASKMRKMFPFDDVIVRSSNELQRLNYMAGDQDSSPSNGCKTTFPILIVLHQNCDMHGSDSTSVLNQGFFCKAIASSLLTCKRWNSFAPKPLIAFKA